MKSAAMIAALIGIAFAASSSSSAFAQSSVPGANCRPKVATPTPPPPPRGPDKFTTQTKPPGLPGNFSGGPNQQKIKPKGRTFCYADEDCTQFVANCIKNDGGPSTEDDGNGGGTTVCTYYDVDG